MEKHPPYSPKRLRDHSTPIMAEMNSKVQEKEVRVEGEVNVDETPSATRFTFELVASMRVLHKDPGQRVKDESTKTHYVSRFIFKVNNTLSITRVSLNKNLKESHELEAQMLKSEIGKVETTKASGLKISPGYP